MSYEELLYNIDYLRCEELTMVSEAIESGYKGRRLLICHFITSLYSEDKPSVHASCFHVIPRVADNFFLPSHTECMMIITLQLLPYGFYMLKFRIRILNRRSLYLFNLKFKYLSIDIDSHSLMALPI